MDRKISGIPSTTPDAIKVGDLVRYTGHDYKSLQGVELTVSEIAAPWVFCKRKSGTDAPGFCAKDIEKIT